MRSRILVIGGENDVSDIHVITERIASQAPGAQKTIIKGAGHLVPMEKPDEFNRLAMLFLNP